MAGKGIPACIGETYILHHDEQKGNLNIPEDIVACPSSSLMLRTAISRHRQMIIGMAQCCTPMIIASAPTSMSVTALCVLSVSAVTFGCTCVAESRCMHVALALHIASMSACAADQPWAAQTLAPAMKIVRFIASTSKIRSMARLLINTAALKTLGEPPEEVVSLCMCQQGQ